jgi:hypothetical protein
VESSPWTKRLLREETSTWLWKPPHKNDAKNWSMELCALFWQLGSMGLLCCHLLSSPTQL